MKHLREGAGALSCKLIEFGTSEEIPRRLPHSQPLCWQAEYNCASPERLPSLEAICKALIVADAVLPLLQGYPCLAEKPHAHLHRP